MDLHVMSRSEASDVIARALTTVVLSRFCPAPDAGAYSTVTSTGQDFGDVAIYNCLSGYQPVAGDKLRTCTDLTGVDGEWSGQPLSCKEIEAKRPQRQSIYSLLQRNHSACPSDWFQYFDTPFCFKFFTERLDWDSAKNYCASFGGSLATVTSNQMALWLVNLQRATASRATGWFWIGVNDDDEEGIWRTPSGKKVSYFRWQDGQPNEHTSANCVGVSTRHDNLKTKHRWYDRQCGEWWNFLCEVRVGCPDISRVLHASFTITGYTNGSRVTYSCDVGYHVTSGSLQRECLENNRWSESPPICERITCGDPGLLHSGIVHSTGNKFNDSATYTCNHNWTLMFGDRTRHCAEDGHWTGRKPHCIPSGIEVTHVSACEGEVGRMICKPGQLVTVLYATYGQIIGSNTFCGSEVSSRTNHCQSPNALTIVKKYCREQSECSIPNGVSLFGRPCYRGNHSLDVWFKCTGCGFPMLPDHCDVEWTGLHHGDVSSYTCLPGYNRTDGDDALRCTESGHWNGTLPTCTRVICDDVSVAEGASIVNITGRRYTDVIVYTCESGFYHASGDIYRECLANGTWSGGPFVCQRISCGKPPKGINTRVAGTSYLFGDIVRFQCFFGYDYVNGSLSRQCLQNGTWSGETQICEEKPGPPANEIKATWKLVKEEAPGSPFIGGAAIIFLVGAITFIVILDLATCGPHYAVIRRNISDFRNFVIEKWQLCRNTVDSDSKDSREDRGKHAKDLVVLESGRTVSSDVVTNGGVNV